jgi:replicative DNA helicase
LVYKITLSKSVIEIFLVMMSTKKTEINKEDFPKDLEAEKALLGSIIISGKYSHEIIDEIGDRLKPEYFFELEHQKVYSSILQLWLNQEPIDLIHLQDMLNKLYNKENDLKKIDQDYLMGLVAKSSMLSNPVETVKILREKYILRTIIQTGEEMRLMGFKQDQEANTILDIAQKKLFEISLGNVEKNFVKLSEILNGSFEKLEQLHHSEDSYRGIPTGFTDLDDKIGGLQNSDMVIVACRPSMGKTALSLEIAKRVAMKDIGVAYFSLEMASDQLVERMIASTSKVDFHKIRSGNMSNDEKNHEFEKIGAAIGVLADLPLWIDDSSGSSILEIRSKARRLKHRNNIGLIIIDYLQLMTGGNDRIYQGNRVQEVADISRNLKILAKDLNVPIMALSQLSRKVESRDDKRPVLSDLRESGCLTGDTLIQLINGSQVTIKSLINNFKDKQVFGLNQNSITKLNKLEKLDISNVFTTGVKQTYTLSLVSGKSIKATANHKFLTQQGWKRLDELKQGECIATPEFLPATKPKTELSEEEVILLAHLIGDGCILPRQPFHYTTNDEENIQIVANISQKLFGIKSRTVDHKSYKHLYLSSPYRLTKGKQHPITIWYKDKLGINLNRSYDKVLPDILFEQSNELIKIFLHHLWATDGNISISHNKKRDSKTVQVYYASTSKTLINQVQTLLLRFKINSTIRTIKKASYRNCYHLWIQSSNDLYTFLELINSYGQRGQITSICLELLQNTIIKANPNNNVYDKYLWQQINQIRTEKGITTREFCKLINTQYCGSALYKSNIGKNRLKRIADALQNPELKSMVESEIYWDKVKSITEASLEKVYDITVPSHHNFIANNIIVHNSIEQDADVVMFIHREDYYNRDLPEEKKGKAELIVAKNRNGETGMVEVAWVRHLATFDNLYQARQTLRIEK